MEKQKKQLIIMVVLRVVLIAAYFGAKVISENQNSDESEETENYTVTAIDSDTVTSFSFYSGDTLLKFEKSGEEWKNSEDTSIDLDESAVESLLEKACSLTSDICIEDYDELSAYGLDEPQDIIAITTEEGTTIIFLGNENEFDGGYYFMIENDEKVYMTTSTVVNAFDSTVEDLTVEEEETETESETEAENVTETEEELETETATES